MKHINILTPSPDQLFYSHINHQLLDDDYNIQENSDEDIKWDCVVVFQNVKKPLSLNCADGNLLYFCGEPPMMAPCPHAFTEQFDQIILPHPSVQHKNKTRSHGFLNWSLGFGSITRDNKYDYQSLASLEPKKTKMISVVTSNQNILPGHQRRLQIVEKLQKDYPGIIDFYGRGYKTIDYKAEALEDYMFHICMENSFIPDYWTEKFSDPVLAQSVPIYAGCTNIERYVGDTGYYKFDINNYETLKRIVDTILVNPSDVYMSKKTELEILRKRIMEEQNLIPYVINKMQARGKTASYKHYTIKPMCFFQQYKWQMCMIRVKRLALRTASRIFNS